MQFDIVIVGGGHAGLEAAWAASQYKELKVAMITLPEIPIASAPCNPAIGGVGKGQVVREIDALGGAMGYLADHSAIQYRILNESKGFAVQSTRVQIDKDKYAQEAEKLINNTKRFEVIRTLAQNIQKEGDVFKIATESGVYTAKKIIVTTGTFLNGQMHTGEVTTKGGRVDCRSVDSFSNIFSAVKMLPCQFKTGTPARLDINSIDFSKMSEQESDERTMNFHFSHKPNERFVKQVSCHITFTNEDTMGVIRDNKERSPMFNGRVKGVGARYCPSIEDKAYRYPDKNKHHVFVEPEGLDLDTVYPNGISTSLPLDAQEAFIRTIPGLENAKILIPGYAVEYDVVDTTDLDITLQSQSVPGAYFAGQVNGTSGYEEAAGQGMIAGYNAAFSLLGKGEFILDRQETYIGVMVEDLVSDKRDEPYRLFTARSENRLFIREDNTLIRMAPYRSQLGLNTDLDAYYKKFLNTFDILMELTESFIYKANIKNKEFFKKHNFGSLNTNILLAELMRRPELSPIDVLQIALSENGITVDERIVRAVAISTKYSGYIKRADVENEKVNRLAKKQIDWQTVINSPNISFECKQRIEEIKPTTFGQLKRINGLRHATLAFVAGNIL
jgi:tRNA uridine 5-carboxymethylaminomethyl modification enzyme